MFLPLSLRGTENSLKNRGEKTNKEHPGSYNILNNILSFSDHFLHKGTY